MKESAEDIAILFWFYKEPTVVADRLRGIRTVNPGVRIFGLYGGAHGSIEEFSATCDLLDDLWMHPEMSAEWAWRNGDLMLARWYAERGKHLDWRQVFVHQWDLLTTIPARDFATSDQGHILLPGVRPLDEVAERWVWIQPWSIYFGEFQSFSAHPVIEGRQLLGCVFILATLTRKFLTDYVTAAHDIPGFMEYRLPTIASILGYRFAPSEVRPDWGDRGDPLLNGNQREVSMEQVRERFLHSGQIKICHPMRVVVPWAELLSQPDNSQQGCVVPIGSLQGIDETNSRAPVAIFQVPPAFPGFAAGGSQVITMSLARALVSTGYPVLLFSGTTDGARGQFKSEGIWYRSAFHITKHVLEDGEPQIRLFADDRQLLERCSVAFMFDRVFALPKHVEPILILDTAAYKFAQAAVTSENWSHMIVPSEYMFRQVGHLLRAGGQAARLQRVHIVANPVNQSHLGLSDELPQVRSGPGETIRLLFPHRADRDKGIRESVRLLSLMSPLRDTVLTIVVDQSPTAEPNLYASVVEMVRSLDLSRIVEFLPWLPLNQMGELYASADVTLCIGDFPEGFGLVCLESILCGTPVVARNAGAQTQLLPPGHGCFVAPEDEAELAQFVCDLVADPSLPEQVLRGRSHIQRNYSTESFLQGFVTIAGLH